MKFTHAVTAVAAAGLAFSPIAAQAGTRASTAALGVSSAQVAVPMSGKRKSSKVSDEQNLNAAIVGGVIVLIGAGICAAACGGGNKSNGV